MEDVGHSELLEVDLEKEDENPDHKEKLGGPDTVERKVQKDQQRTSNEENEGTKPTHKESKPPRDQSPLPKSQFSSPYCQA